MIPTTSAVHGMTWHYVTQTLQHRTVILAQGAAQYLQFAFGTFKYRPCLRHTMSDARVFHPCWLTRQKKSVKFSKLKLFRTFLSTVHTCQWR